LSSLSSVSIPKSPGEALSHLEWRQAMIDEMCALQSSGTWELVPLPAGKILVGCRWLYTVKVGLDGKFDGFKARLVSSVIHKLLDWITGANSHLWSKWLMSESSSLLQSSDIGLSF
jgi:hypothetical protein